MNYLLLGVLMIGGPALYAMVGVFLAASSCTAGSRKDTMMSACPSS